MILMSERGIPDGYRHMDGFSSHTFKWVNDKGEAFWVKYHFKTNQGNKGLPLDKIKDIEHRTLDYANEDLYENIKKGNFPSWTWYVQIMPEKDGLDYKYDIFDITKVWPHGDYPLMPVGQLVLNRLPDNFFAESEQVALSPTNLVPGIEPSNDRILQGRIFAYNDTQRHRLGGSFEQIPINCPYRCRVDNYQRDGPMIVNGNQGSGHNYEPSSLGGPVPDPKYAWHKYSTPGEVARHKFQHPNCDYD